MAVSKVLNAKRQVVTVTYEYLDGKSTSIVVQSISTNEDKDIGKLQKEDSTTVADLFEKIVRIHLQLNDAEIINHIVKEQYEEGNIIDFANALKGLIEEAKKGK